MKLKDLWAKIKYIDNYAFVKEKFPDYKVNKLIFNTAIAIIIVLFLFVLYQNDWSFDDRLYVNCNNVGGCENPFYINNYIQAGYDTSLCPNAELCSYEKLPYGYTYGRDASFLEENFSWMAVLLMAFAVLLNHFLYNGGMKFDLKIDEEE
jgi:hypothetical protein